MVRRDFFDFCAAPGTSTSWEVLPRAEADLQGPRRAASFVEVWRLGGGGTMSRCCL